MTQPITIYAGGRGPNPWKVLLILEELALPYKKIEIPYADVKSPSYTAINPNGRLPSIHDPNTGITLWESGAIIEYLVETYDKENKISFAHGSKEYFLAKQYLHFQMSGQGPYFGQAAWFLYFHPEKLPSAQERYINEVKRVSGVLEGLLAGEDKYLVGGKFSYADAAFVPWYGAIEIVLADVVDFAKEYPNLKAWLERVRAQPGVAKALVELAKVIAAENAKKENAKKE